MSTPIEQKSTLKEIKTRLENSRTALIRFAAIKHALAVTLEPFNF